MELKLTIKILKKKFSLLMISSWSRVLMMAQSWYMIAVLLWKILMMNFIRKIKKITVKYIFPTLICKENKKIKIINKSIQMTIYILQRWLVCSKINYFRLIINKAKLIIRIIMEIIKI